MLELDDRLQPFRDAMLVSAGLLNPAHAHPGAADILLDRDYISKAVTARTYTTSDLSDITQDMLSVAVIQAQRRIQAHREICVRLSPTRKSEAYPGLDVDIKFAKVNEAGENSAEFVSLVDRAGVAMVIGGYQASFGLSRRAFINGDLDMAAISARSAGAGASRLESRLVFGLLETNPNLGDGSPIFHDDHINTVAGALAQETLGEAVGKLAEMKTTSDEFAETEAAFLVVPSSLKVYATSLIFNAGIDMRVVSTPNISANSWYVLASPDDAPVVGLGHWRGYDEVQIDELRGPLNGNLAFDGFRFGASFDVGVVPLGRRAIRGTAA